MTSQLCTPGINPTWSGCIILLICCWIQFVCLFNEEKIFYIYLHIYHFQCSSYVYSNCHQVSFSFYCNHGLHVNLLLDCDLSEGKAPSCLALYFWWRTGVGAQCECTEWMKAGYGGMAGGSKETQDQLPFTGLVVSEQKSSVQESLPPRAGQHWAWGFVLYCTGARLAWAFMWLHLYLLQREPCCIIILACMGLSPREGLGVAGF